MLLSADVSCSRFGTSPALLPLIPMPPFYSLYPFKGTLMALTPLNSVEKGPVFYSEPNDQPIHFSDRHA
jgi:hypothetical protein